VTLSLVLGSFISGTIGIESYFESSYGISPYVPLLLLKYFVNDILRVEAAVLGL